VAYISSWERIAEALGRVIATGLTESEAKRQLCAAIADKTIDVRLILAADTQRGWSEEVSTSEPSIPPHLSPEDIDWGASRPHHQWPPAPQRPGEPASLFALRTMDRLMGRTISLLEVRAQDVERVFGGSTQEIVARLPADSPTRASSAGAKSRGVRQAIGELWPEGMPAGLVAKDRDNKIANWFRDRGLSVPGRRTIQRAFEQPGSPRRQSDK